MESKIFKKTMSGICSLAMIAGCMAAPVSADDEVTFTSLTSPDALATYLADEATLTQGAVTSEKEVTINGSTVSVTMIGTLGAGLTDAVPPTYNDATAGTAIFTVPVEDAGNYDIAVYAMNSSSRRVDLNVNGTIVEFPTSDSDEYSGVWTVISDSGSRDVFTYTFEGVALNAGENTIEVGTIDSSWCPDLCSIAIYAAEEDPITEVTVTTGDGTATVAFPDEVEGTIYVAKYENGVLTDVDITEEASGKTTVTYEAEDTETVMLFVWDDMTPLCNAVVLSEATATPEPTEVPTEAPTTAPTTAPTETPDREYTVLYTQDYEDVTATDWTSSSSDRYVPMLKTDGTNTWSGVDMTTRYNNGATLTSPSYASYVSGLTEYALEFDAAIGYTNASQNPTFKVNTSDGALLTLTPNSGTEWVINGYDETTLTFATSGYTNDVSSANAASTSTWYHYIIIFQDGLTHLKVLDADGNTVFEPTIILSQSTTGALTTITYATARYYANFEIDNIMIRTLDQYDEFGEQEAEFAVSAEFTSELNTKITQPASDSPVHYPITVAVTGNYGNDLTEDCTVEWSLIGLDKEDGYISLTAEEGTDLGTTGDAPGSTDYTAYFNVRNGVSNWFGMVQAVVTFDEDHVFTVTTPFAVIGASEASTNIAPETGYPENMSDYADGLVGYAATANAITGQDLVLNNWSIYGSSSTRTLTLEQDEDGTKYLRFAAGSGSGSTVGVYQLAEQSSQYIVDMTVRFTGSAMAFGHYYNTPNNGTNDPNWTASYASNALTIGTETISGLNSENWFRIVVSADESAGTTWVKVYDESGALVGEASDIAMESTYTSTQKYFCFLGTYPVDLASFRIYYPTISTMTVSSESEVVQVPESGADATTAELTAVLTDTDGYNMTGAVTWSLEEEYAGVSIDSTGNQTATLTVTDEAGSGTITVLATYGTTTASKEITLSTSGNSIAFTSSSSSLTIPFSGEDDVTQTYAAELRDKDGNAIADAGAITLSMVDATGADATVTGVTFDAATGVLTVTSAAAAKTVYIKASTTYDGEDLSSRIKVSIHGLSFAFGSDEPEDESYTQVTASTLYTAKLGYGFASTSDLTDASASVSGSADYRFKATVPNGNYVVTVDTTSSTMTSEVVESVTATTGISKSGTSFSVAVCDGVLDLTFLADSSVSSIVITQAATKTANEKPAVYAIGDSTTNNSGDGNLSWGNCVATGLVTVPDSLLSFSNNGMAGRDSVNFYNQGRVETVLLSICPGDYVTVNMGINSKETNESVSYYTLLDEYYVQGIIQRGGIPVIVTATPQGPVGSYTGNYSNGVFTCNRGTGAHNGDLRNIAQKYDLNIIELGYWGDALFNGLTDEDVAAYNEANGTSYTTVLELVQSWYPTDHNHYSSGLGTQIADYILGSVAEIAGGSTEFNQANDTHINEQ